MFSAAHCSSSSRTRRSAGPAGVPIPGAGRGRAGRGRRGSRCLGGAGRRHAEAATGSGKGAGSCGRRGGVLGGRGRGRRRSSGSAGAGRDAAGLPRRRQPDRGAAAPGFRDAGRTGTRRRRCMRRSRRYAKPSTRRTRAAGRTLQPRRGTPSRCLPFPLHIARLHDRGHAGERGRLHRGHGRTVRRRRGGGEHRCGTGGELRVQLSVPVTRISRARRRDLRAFEAHKERLAEVGVPGSGTATVNARRHRRDSFPSAVSGSGDRVRRAPVDGPWLRGVGQVAYGWTAWDGSGPILNGLVRRGGNRGRTRRGLPETPMNPEFFAVFVLSLPEPKRPGRRAGAQYGQPAQRCRPSPGRRLSRRTAISVERTRPPESGQLGGSAPSSMSARLRSAAST